MATLRDYFRRVFGIEDEVVAKVQAILAAVTFDEFMEDPDTAAAMLKVAIRQEVESYMAKAESVGRTFASSIVAGAGSSSTAIPTGVASMERALDAAVDEFVLRVTRQIASQQAAGVLNPVVNPALFDTLRNRMVEAAENSIQAVSNAAVLDAAKEDSEPWTWLTVHDNRVCPDCEPRHNVTKPLKEWIELGLPKSGFSVCGDRDRCVLLPEDYVDDEVDTTRPIKISKADFAQFS